MKQNDTLYCKKNFGNEYIKNKEYYIHDVEIYGPRCGHVVIPSEHYWLCQFSIEDDDDLYIWNWFQTKQEIRKDKLKKLNNENL